LLFNVARPRRHGVLVVRRLRAGATERGGG